MTNLTRLLAILSTSALCACAGAPLKPVGSIAHLNAQSAEPYMLSFNFETDFDADLKRLPTAPGTHIPVPSLSMLHGYWLMDSPSKEHLEAYAMQWKARYQALQKRCGQ